MSWNKDKSLALSVFCVYLFMALVAAAVVSAPWVVRGLLARRAPDLLGASRLFCITLWAAAAPAAAALFALRTLLRNIRDNEVFFSENVRMLRRLSWYCIWAGLIFAVSTAYYAPFLLAAAAAAFMGLILRVLKNVFAEAVRIKTENDLTI